MADSGSRAAAGGAICEAGFGGTRGALHMTLPADPRAVRAALIRIGAELRSAGIAAADAGNAELVLAEALNNIVEHAFPVPQRDASVELTIVPGCAGIGCELRDNGRPMPRGRLPRTALPGLPSQPGAGMLESLPEGGFGWFLIRTLARDLCYTREMGTNRLVLRIPYGIRH